MAEREWTRLRRASGLVEWVCQHGVGHPDNDSVDRMEKRAPNGCWHIHGCDGCCRREDFPGRGDWPRA